LNWRSKPKGSEGVTLIEVAIVLVILGLLLGLGAGLIGMLTKRAKIIESRETVDAAVEALISYAAGNKCLTENKTQANLRKTTDAWNQPLFIRVANETKSNSELGGQCTTYNATICDRKSTNLTVKICSDAACTSYQPVNNVAFVVASKGPNYNLQIMNGTNEIRVYAPALRVDSYSGTYEGVSDPNRVEEFDDIVKWVTLDELRAKMGCPMQIIIINDELPYGFENSPYRSAVFAEGGVPFPSSGKYKWCRQGNLPSGLSANPSTSATDCLSLSETSWGQADNVTISGTPANSTSGSYSLTFFVRDNNGNIAQKTLVLTIQPQQASSGPIGAQVSFANNINEFQQAEGDPNAVQVNGTTLVLGGGVLGSNGYGCFWYPSRYQLNGKKMRAYFKFKFTNIDNSSDSTSYADGFTFAVVTENMPNSACGGAGINIGFGGLNYDSVAVEFDTYPNGGSGGRNDPTNYNHLAIVKRGNNMHGASTAMGNNPSCPSAGCFYTSKPTWLEDNVDHSARVEIHTRCDSTCSACGSNSQNYALIKAWVDCLSCNDLTQDYSAPPTVQDCFPLPTSSMNNVKFGFTEGTGGKTQNVEIKDFGIGFY
jgi:type II secretory pathway pseudopilin PulG